ncbi:MAG: glycosyltransferase family 9 protein [Bryobacteraceae bacterium]|nr:glycosyltransferase family 9 protein [Bryobacteraceae bacterium]
MEVRKIAVLRANAVGDFIFALPALEALRAAYPSAEIVLLGLRWHRVFLEGRPSPIDRVIEVPASRGINEVTGKAEDPKDLDAFFQRMAAERFDIALQLHGGGRYSNPFVLRLKAGLTAGLKAPDAIPLDRWVPYVYYQPEILRYLEAVSLVGATAQSIMPRVAVTAKDFAEAAAAVPRDLHSVVVLNPGAGDGRRRWPPSHFAELGDRLSSQGLTVVVHGSEKDRSQVESVAEGMTRTPLVACGNLSLGGLAGLLSQARLLVSNDSGPLHLAAAVGAPTLGIYWCGNLINAGPVARSLHRPVISWRLNCPQCGRDCATNSCDHHCSFVADISVEEVFAAAKELLAFNRPQPWI